MNRKNLQILSDGLLELIPPVIPPTHIQFDMRVFTEGNTWVTTCHTAGCAVGWAPFFGIKKKDDENFVEFSQRVFQLGDSAWTYLFSATWIHTDNTKRGAGLRIKHYLEKGLPRNWEDQLNNNAPLSYL